MPEYFNSRPSARGDPFAQNVGQNYIAISIHAPPRGATISTLARAIWRSYFNSRPSARGDFCNDLLVACYTISIHAPPRGATARRWRTFPQLARFQFTPLREGRRFVFVDGNFPSCISIHAPPRGATASAPDDTKAQFISIHAPPRGATISVRDFARKN